MSAADRPAQVTHEELMRFLDGETAPEERARVERVLAGSTELARELAIFRAMKGDVQGLTFQADEHHRSVWDRVHRRIARPIGWILLAGGAAAWIAYGAWVFSTGPSGAWEKLAVGAMVIGVLVLLAGVVIERYRESLTDPYRDVYR